MVSASRLLSVAFILAILPPSAGAQDLYEHPISPLSPTSASECSLITDRYQRDLDHIVSVHQECLDAHPRKDHPDLPPSSPTCSVNACQFLHNKMREVQAADSSVRREYDTCMSRVQQQQQEEQRRENEAQREREEQDRQRQMDRERQEQQQQQQARERAQWQREHDAKVRAAQDNLQRVLNNNTRAQNTLNGAFDQLRATLEQQRAEREAREELQRLDREERERQEQEQSQEQELEQFHRETMEKLENNRASNYENTETDWLAPDKDSDRGDTSEMSANRPFGDLSSFFSKRDEAPSEKSTFDEPVIKPETEVLAAGLFDDNNDKKIKSFSDTVKSVVNTWLENRFRKAQDDTTSNLVTGKSFDQLPEQFKRDYSLWRSAFDRIGKPFSRKEGYKFVQRFDELFDLWQQEMK